MSGLQLGLMSGLRLGQRLRINSISMVRVSKLLGLAHGQGKFRVIIMVRVKILGRVGVVVRP